MNVIADRIVRKNPFLRDWGNYGIVDIFNPVATAQYQHSVTIASKPGMMHDFRDLRFFQPDGIEIPFWIESKTDGSTSFVWFKPYSLSQRKAYVFYGNREAVSQSNGDKTFDFFDDFLGSGLSALWGSTGTVSVANSEVSISANSHIDSVASFSRNIAIGAKYKTTNNAAWSAAFAWGDGIPIASHALSYMTGIFGNTFYWGYNTGSAFATLYAISSPTPTTQTYYRHEICMNASQGAHCYIWLASSGRGSEIHTETQGTLDSKCIRLGGHTTAATEICDFVYTRKYTATEPVCQFNTFGLKV